MFSLLELEGVQSHEWSNQSASLKTAQMKRVEKQRWHWLLFSVWDRWQLLCLLNQSSFKLLLLTKILILALGPSRSFLTLKNYLEIITTVENSLKLLITPRGLSYILLMVCSLICLLLYPYFCGFRVLVLLTNYGVARYFPVHPHTYSWRGSQT